MSIPHLPRDLGTCPLERDGMACSVAERCFSAIESRAQTTERLMADHVISGFAELNKRLDSMSEAIGELRADVRTEETKRGALSDRVSAAEEQTDRASAVADQALTIAAAKRARKRGRSRGQIESAAVTLLGVVAYALARHYGVPLP